MTAPGIIWLRDDANGMEPCPPDIPDEFHDDSCYRYVQVEPGDVVLADPTARELCDLIGGLVEYVDSPSDMGFLRGVQDIIREQQGGAA